MDLRTTQMSLSAFDIDALEACIELLFFTACADGVVDDEERASFERLVAKATCGEVGPEAVRRVLAHLERRPRPELLAGRLRQIASRLGELRVRKGILSLAVTIAGANGEITAEERAFLEEAADAFEVPRAELAELLP